VVDLASEVGMAHSADGSGECHYVGTVQDRQDLSYFPGIGEECVFGLWAATALVIQMDVSAGSGKRTHATTRLVVDADKESLPGTWVHHGEY